MKAALSFRQGARCYRIRVRDGKVTETPLAAKRMRSRPGRYDEIAELRRTLRALPGVRRLG